MSSYYNLIYNSNLYDSAFINTFGVTGPHWVKEDDRSRELSLRHDMTCILLCNREQFDLREELRKLATTYGKRGYIDHSSSGPPAKKMAINQEIIDPENPQAGPSRATSHMSLQTIISTSSSSSNGTSEDDKSLLDPEAIYRLILLEGMPNASQIQYEFAMEWGIPCPRSTWDIVDRKEKKFIEVKVTADSKNALTVYNEKSVDCPNHSALVIVDPVSGDCTYYNHPGKLKGETKVKRFIINRHQILLGYNIQDSELQDKKDLIGTVFSCSSFNAELAEWEAFITNSWSKDWDHVKLYSKCEASPSVIRASELVSLLEDPSERLDCPPVQWKGKLLPEGFVEYYETRLEKDKEIVDEFVKLYCNPEEFTEKTYKGYMEQPAIFDIIPFLNIPSMEAENTFEIKVVENPHTLPFLQSLGWGMKRGLYTNDTEKMTQKETRPIVKHMYTPWVSRVIRKFRELSPSADEYPGYKPFCGLFETPMQREHLLANICEEQSSLILRDLLDRNAAHMAQRCSGFYSKLGGAYLNRAQYKIRKSDHKVTMGVFPLIKVLRNSENHNERRRLNTGVCIVGPNHARNGTDRIPIITVEIINEELDDHRVMLRNITKYAIIRYEGYSLLIRQNSIMKEDPCYLSFSHNCLYPVFNMFGVLTIENPLLLSNQDIRMYMEEAWQRDKEWYAERFAEGMFNALTSSSRDEGYMAGARKLFMVLLCMRRGEICATFDLQGFADSINECLLDNPLSMYFHETFLLILHHYASKEKKKEQSQQHL